MKKKYVYTILICLILASCAAFGRIAGNDFIYFDDGRYLTGNHHVQSGFNPENIKWAFTSVVSGNWHPLTMLSHALDWRMFGANPAGHHIVSLLLHICAVISLFLFLNKTTNNIWSSAFAAALFALHPLRVESVAWAAERKDVLSMFFGMSCLYAYAFYTQSLRRSAYFLCLTLFALSLLSKPMLVTLPFVLLLLDYWPLKRWPKDFTPPKRLVREKIPFLFLTFLSSILTLWAQNKGGLVISMDNIPFAARLLNAIVSYVDYLGKIFWPVDLAIHYPYVFPFPLGGLVLSILILLGISVFVVFKIKKLPFLFVGWFIYLGTLVPVIGLVQVASQAMADRYTYFPSIGVAIMVAWGIPVLFPQNEIRKKILLPAAIAIIFVLAFSTWKQCGYWKSSITLFNHAVQVTKNNDMAHGGLAIALLNEGKTEEAIEQFNQAIRVKKIYQFYRLRGIAYEKLGNHQQAIEDYNAAISLKPHIAEDYFNRAIASLHLRLHQSAIDDFSQAIRLKQDHADAYNNRGYLYLMQKQTPSGCADARKACALGNCNTLAWAGEKGYCH